MSKVSIKDVANAAGVSVSSVSFFMNRPERLSQASRDHIGEICKKLGYAPGKNRRGPKLGRRSRFKTRNICFYCMAPMTMEELLRYPTISRFLGCMQEELHKHHCRLVISGTGDSCQIPVTLDKKNCDGVVLFGKATNEEFYNSFKAKVAELPVIWTGASSNDEKHEYDHVFYSNKKVAELAASYIKKKNYHNVAIFNSHPEHPEYHERIRFFEETVKKYNVDLYKFEIPKRDAKKPQAELIKILADMYVNADIPKLDIGYFCSDVMMVKFNYEMFSRKREIDFEEFGCNGDKYIIDSMAKQPATIDICLHELARQTVKRLINRIDNYRKPMQTTEIIIEPKLLLPKDN